MKTLNLTASNIKCDGCVSNIKNGLAEIDGIESITVTIENSSIQISGNLVNHEEIKKKLAELGYPVKTS